MAKKWLVRLSYDNPQWSTTDPVRFDFEKDKNRIDEFFEAHSYKILIIDINQENSYKVPNKEIYILAKDFFKNYNLHQNSPDNSTQNSAVQRPLIRRPL